LVAQLALEIATMVISLISLIQIQSFEVLRAIKKYFQTSKINLIMKIYKKFKYPKKPLAINSYRSPKPGSSSYKHSTLPSSIRNGYSSVSAMKISFYHHRLWTDENAKINTLIIIISAVWSR
jgi:hypothetical protein